MTAPAFRAARDCAACSAPWRASAAISVGLVEGAPRALPGIALGSTVLLHAERALALVAIVITALSVLARAANGRLPIELSTSGLRYEAEAADRAAVAAAELQAQLDDLMVIVDALADRLDAPQRHP
jgi:hypothetical protein